MGFSFCAKLTETIMKKLLYFQKGMIFMKRTEKIMNWCEEHEELIMSACVSFFCSASFWVGYGLGIKVGSKIK